jgi:RNA recognition motif-containing protein
MVIQFYDLRAAQAMRKCQFVLHNRNLNLSYGPLLPIVDARKPPNNGTIVVFHLRKGVADEEIRAEFAQFGDIRQIRSAPAKVTQRFVEYFDKRSALKALKGMKGKRVLNSKISVEFSLPGGHRKAVELGTTGRVPTIERVSKWRLEYGLNF